MYINCKTWFSFRYGTLQTEELVDAAAEAGVDALALTNINSTCDLWTFVALCKAKNIRPIAGVEIRNGNKFLYLLLAANNNGLEAIHRFLSAHLQEKRLFPENAGTHTVFDRKEDGFIVYPPGAKSPALLEKNEYIGIQPAELTRLYGVNMELYGHKFVVRQPVTFRNAQQYAMHRLLRAIDENTLLSRLSADSVAGEHETFLAVETLRELFKHHPGLVTNTYELMNACTVEMDFRTDKTKASFNPTKEADRQHLAKLAHEGCRERYGNSPMYEEAVQRVDKELAIINKLGFNAYFMITWDIIRYAQHKGYYYVGRGSGANSIVAYCLYITEVDPIELNLYFERFLNPQRTAPPDFDIDFSWTDRDDIIAYVFDKYGKDHVALLGMYTTFQQNALIRELGKVFGLPKEEIDQLSEGGPADDAIKNTILRYAFLLRDFPNHLSIHPGGILISEAPIARYATTDLPPKGFPTAQIDMHVAEDINLIKLDILSQRGLGHIRDALKYIRENRQVNINIHDVEKFKSDAAVRKNLRNAHTIGCFYIESPGMRQLLQKLRCSEYLTLVAASSIIRPGVASSGMMRAYVERFHDRNKVRYEHPVMQELLEDTFGVMVYQEDVIKVAHYFAGMDMADADVLRRAMSGKYRGNKEMLRIKAQFFSNCRALGREEEATAEIWRQIESFGGYSFSKAHSASFAVESYQSLYLKTYYPKEFMVAVINNFGGFYSRELYFYELHKTGAAIHPPCINESHVYTRITGNDVYTGFIHVKSLEEKLVEKILEERSRWGRFLHLQDFIERVAPPLEQLNLLIRLNAFRFTGKNKKQLLWEANFLQKKNRSHIPSSQSLFREEPTTFQLPAFRTDALEDIFDQVELLGFPLHSPFPLTEENPAHFVSARDMEKHLGQTITMLGYLITVKNISTIKNERMSFGTFMDDKLDWIDTVHFPDNLRNYPISGKGFYRITGKVVNDLGAWVLEVQHMEKAGLKKTAVAAL